jgi:hypothetical protein
MSIIRIKMTSVARIEMTVALLLWTFLDEQVPVAGIQAGWSCGCRKLKSVIPKFTRA